ncbi:hypothetical protein JR316_0010625 [Psilocybe cubensis]|uniref:Uncharacterized protein n=2 Tax=Psilocybe cubensis TaxID=181762 RepID=A0ACB8GNB7_PSICU|nr:hypothetical protein JR316_0010625 [Psilocybe cubensis]KAH9476711.1 hypothetical protein JR316_0010625 [Psilocybe cubensis]
MSKPSNIGKSSFGRTISFITDIKLAELEKQRLAYQAHIKVIDDSKALAEKGDILGQVKVLAKAVESWTGSGAVSRLDSIGGKLQLSDLDFWIHQAERDPSFNIDVARGWAQTLEDHMHHNTLRFNAAKLFGNLFNEWISSGDSAALTYQSGVEEETFDSDAMSFVDVGRTDLRAEKEKLESVIFEDYPIDTDKLHDYLEGLFDSAEGAAALERLRNNFANFGYALQRKPITTADVGYAIQGLLSSGLMDEENRDVLKAFKGNGTVMKELASVLNMRLSNLGSWCWPKEPMVVEFRRHLHGKYRGFTDPEIIDALFLQHIAVAWQVEMKIRLFDVFDSKAWARPGQPTPANSKRWSMQLQDGDGSFSVNSARDDNRRQYFFLNRLQDEVSIPSSYDDLVDAPEGDDEDENMASPATVKRKLLHVMTTDCYLNKTLHGSHCIVRSDLEWFGPSLPHDTIFTVLEFLGFPTPWLNFFRAFLATPLRFPEDTQSRIRKRGTPIAYAMSVVFGEAVLFVMDLAVNQRAGGLHLYRMHDDLWIWDSDAKKVADGWAEMNTYADLAGLKFNKKKTGSTFVGTLTDDHVRLPEGDVRWGFLKFDPNTGRFVIDQEDVNRHIAETKRQLAGSKSVFGWINAYNKYVASFLRNFGGIPANCFTDAHINDLIETMGRIQTELFPKYEGTDGGAVGYLKKTIEDRFDIKDMPDGYFYFPIARGGLGLRNVALDVLGLEKFGRPLASNGKTNASPEDLFKKQADGDRSEYEASKERRDSRVGPTKVAFMSFDEYMSLRESWLSRWGETYREMLCSPNPRRITLMPKIREAMRDNSRDLEWDSMDWYEKWILSVYGGAIIDSFGGLEVVDHDLIPIGMVELFRTSRMNLEQ